MRVTPESRVSYCMSNPIAQVRRAPAASSTAPISGGVHSSHLVAVFVPIRLLESSEHFDAKLPIDSPAPFSGNLKSCRLFILTREEPSLIAVA